MFFVFVNCYLQEVVYAELIANAVKRCNATVSFQDSVKYAAIKPGMQQLRAAGYSRLSSSFRTINMVYTKLFETNKKVTCLLHVNFECFANDIFH